MIPRKLMRSLALAPCLALVCASQDPMATSAAAPSGKQSDTPVAGETYKTLAHHSRWDYPKEVQIPAGTLLHVVEKGDTLWDLGQRYLGNPYAWPQIWELNKWVKDPHWIFPGDPLLVPDQNKALAAATDVPRTTAPETVAALEPEQQGFRRALAEELAYSYQDYLQMPYLVPEGMSAHLAATKGIRISGGENSDRSNFGDGDKIFLDGGSDQGLKVGDRRVIIKLTKNKLYHPDDPRRVKPMGDVVQQIGVAQLTHVTPKASIAVIERSLDGVERDQYLLPHVEPTVLPLRIRQDTADPVTISQTRGKVVHIGAAIGNVANGAQVIVDLGARQGLKVGDVLLIAATDSWSLGNPRDRIQPKAQTHRYIGQMVVARVGDTASTCRIFRTKDAVQPGMIVFK